MREKEHLYKFVNEHTGQILQIFYRDDNLKPYAVYIGGKQMFTQISGGYVQIGNASRYIMQAAKAQEKNGFTNLSYHYTQDSKIPHR